MTIVFKDYVISDTGSSCIYNVVAICHLPDRMIAFITHDNMYLVSDSCSFKCI